ncbi:copper amine oxidase N-terminal domain-containing protein [Paenibacillus sp. MWE-103]|uniref:Copper amine oxidase N-terminal domain-containing protein n=1 Tax=Paenibacillus artemisiicola TaxID=1172618 RepID=A0ABS3WH01_9BACL|nr:copper amine oxidase N-terminal domain-containing protein [Paenibacillus artemisiicola]MBO7747588.1 copper amine oxidase N-terminal domain-containing protein [Paenibacillus artemisiicola]
MKRWLGLALSLMIALAAFAGTASAATAPTNIKVKLNGEWVIFPAPPVLLNGKTFVEFRTLFAKLGYAIDYNASTKTIKAKSDARTIQMTPTGTTALVDGAKVPVNGEMKLLNGRTMVGVRFIATLSDKDVAWDGVKKIVTIADKKPTAAQQEEAFAAVRGLAAAEDKQDADAYLALFHSQSPLKDALSDSIREQFAKIHSKTDFVDMALDSYSPSEAVVYTVEDATKVSGDGFFPNMEYEIYYTLHREANGKWAIYLVDWDSSTVLDENSLWAQEIQAPDADKTALNDLVNAQTAAINAADLNAYKATLLPGDEGIEDDAGEVEGLISDPDYALKAAVTRSAVVELDADHALVLVAFRYDMTAKDGTTEDNFAVKTVTLYGMEKKDGKWYVTPGSNANELSFDTIDE